MRKSRELHLLPTWVGLAVIAVLSAYCFGTFRDGLKVFEYAFLGIHPAVSRALYNGQVFLSNRPELGIPHDFQFYHGALYTHWGYGVPLLQLPFHWVATILSSDPGFVYFPDRAIFLFYLLLGTALFWIALRTLFESTLSLEDAASAILTTSASAFLLANGLYWLTSMGGYVYELTIAYFTLFQLMAISLFVLYFFNRSTALLVALGAVEGIGLLIRPTGAIYLAAFLALVVLSDEEKRKTALGYCMGVLPFFLAWIFFNHAQSGSFFGTSLATVFSEPSEMHDFRFGGNPCFETFSRKLLLLWHYFSELFFPWRAPERQALIESCGQIKGPEIFSQKMPFVGVVFSLLMAAALWVELRNRRFHILVPLAAALIPLALYVSSGLHFGARYMGDVWPGLILVLLTPLLFQEEFVEIGKKAIWLISGALLILASFKIGSEVVPQLPSIAAVDDPLKAYNPPLNLLGEKISTSVADVRKWEWSYAPFQPFSDNRVASFKECPPFRSPIFELDAVWWENDCRTWAITTVFLGFPESPGEDYVLRIKYQVPDDPDHRKLSEFLSRRRMIEVSIEDQRYLAAFDGTSAEIPFKIKKKAYASNVLPVVVRWTKTFSYSDVLLKRISIEPSPGGPKS